MIQARKNGATSLASAAIPPCWCCARTRVSWHASPADMDLAQYSEVLDTVLGDVRPVGTILAALKSGSARPLMHDDCHRLAYYAWDLIDEVNAKFSALAATLSQAAARCPSGTDADKARLIVTAASLAADGEAEGLAAGKSPGRRLVRLISQVDGILMTPTLANSIADAIGGLDESFFQAVARARPQDVAGWAERYASGDGYGRHRSALLRGRSSLLPGFEADGGQGPGSATQDCGAAGRTSSAADRRGARGQAR